MLKYNKLDLPKNFASGYSLRFQYFFNLVVQMVAKTEERRISFEELYGYIEREHQLNNSDNTKEKEISQ